MISSRGFVEVVVLLFGVAFVAGAVEELTMGGAHSLLSSFSQWFFFDPHLYGVHFLEGRRLGMLPTLIVGIAVILCRPWIVRWVFLELGDEQIFVDRPAPLVGVGLALAGVGLVVSWVVVAATPETTQGLGLQIFSIPGERLLFVGTVRWILGAAFLLWAAVWLRRRSGVVVMTSARYLGVVIALYGLWYVFEFLTGTVPSIGSLLRHGHWFELLSELVIEPVLLTAVVLGRYRLAAFLLRSDADRPVPPAWGLIVAGLVLMSFHLVERGFWQIWSTTYHYGLEGSTAISAPSVLSGAVLLVLARPIATVLVGRR